MTPTDLFDAHFYGRDVDPALIWELDEHRGMHRDATATDFQALRRAAAAPYGSAYAPGDDRVGVKDPLT